MKIPIYEPSQKAIREGPSSYALGAERSTPLNIPKSDMVKWQGVSDFAESVTRIGARMEEADRVQQVSEALALSTQGYADLMDQINTDPKLINASPEEHEIFYTNSMQQIRKQVMDGMSSPRAKEAFSERFGLRTIEGLVDVRALARNRMISKGRASTDAQLSSLVKNLSTTGDFSIIADGQALIAGKTNAGYFNPEEGQQLNERFARDATLGYWNQQILDNPAATYEVLKQEPESLNNLQPAEKTTLLARAQAAAESDNKLATLSGAYTTIMSKYGNNYEAALADINNPNKWSTYKLDYDTSKELDNRFRTLLAERERRERDAENALKTTNDRLNMQVWVDYYNGKLKPEQLDILAKNRQISQSTYTSIRRNMAEETEENNPAVVADLAEKIELGYDVSQDLKEALENGDIKTQTFITMQGKIADRQYTEGVQYISRALKPSDLVYSPDRNIRYAEAVDVYNSRVRSGENPIAAARDIVDGYMGHLRRTEKAQRKPRYGVYDKAGGMDYAATLQKTTQAFTNQMLTSEEYSLEVDLINRLSDMAREREELNTISTDISGRAKAAVRESQ
jgi:hypothetical protein